MLCLQKYLDNIHLAKNLYGGSKVQDVDSGTFLSDCHQLGRIFAEVHMHWMLFGKFFMGFSLGLLGHVVRVVEFIERPLWSFQCL